MGNVLYVNVYYSHDLSKGKLNVQLTKFWNLNAKIHYPFVILFLKTSEMAKFGKLLTINILTATADEIWKAFRWRNCESLSLAEFWQLNACEIWKS